MQKMFIIMGSVVWATTSLGMDNQGKVVAAQMKDNVLFLEDGSIIFSGPGRAISTNQYNIHRLGNELIVNDAKYHYGFQSQVEIKQGKVYIDHAEQQPFYRPYPMFRFFNTCFNTIKNISFGLPTKTEIIQDDHKQIIQKTTFNLNPLPRINSAYTSLVARAYVLQQTWTPAWINTVFSQLKQQPKAITAPTVQQEQNKKPVPQSQKFYKVTTVAPAPTLLPNSYQQQLPIPSAPLVDQYAPLLPVYNQNLYPNVIQAAVPLNDIYYTGGGMYVQPHTYVQPRTWHVTSLILEHDAFVKITGYPDQEEGPFSIPPSTDTYTAKYTAPDHSRNITINLPRLKNVHITGCSKAFFENFNNHPNPITTNNELSISIDHGSVAKFNGRGYLDTLNLTLHNQSYCYAGPLLVNKIIANLHEDSKIYIKPLYSLEGQAEGYSKVSCYTIPQSNNFKVGPDAKLKFCAPKDELSPIKN
jgi:hypothetical protein